MEISDLADILSAHEAFRVLPPGALAALLDRVTLHVFRLGDVVLETGAPGRALFIVYAGRARMVEERPGADPVTLAVLGKGDIFNEDGVLGKPASCTVRAASDLVVLRLDERRLAEIASAHPGFRAAVERRAGERAELAVLSRLRIFAGLKPAALRRLAASVGRVELKAGDQLFVEGDPGDTAYIVREGRLRLFKSLDNRPRLVGFAGPGELVGEIGLLCGLPRLVTAEAATPMVALSLPREVFDEVVSGQGRRAALEGASNELLRLQVFAAAAEAPAPAARTTLDVEWIRPGGWISRRYPVVRTEHPALSGLACLAMVEAFHARSGVDASDVDRRLAEARPDTMDSLGRTAEDLGYLTRQARVAPDRLGELPLPAIVEIEAGEFAVAFAANAKRVIVASPRDGLRGIGRAAFDGSWDGRALCLTHLPTADFSHPGSTAVVRQFLPFAKPHVVTAVFLVALSLVTQALALAPPLLNQVIIDRVLVTFDTALLRLLILGMLIVTVFQLAFGALREYLTAHLLRRMSAAVQLRFFDHILALPVRTILRWRVGDFVVRLNENEKLLRLVSESAVVVILSSAAVVVNLVLLFSMSADLAPVALGFLVAYGALMVVASPRLRAAASDVFDARSEAQSYFIESISGIQTVKSLALEPHAYGTALGLVDRLKRREVRAANLSFHVGQIAGVLAQVAVVVVLGWGASLALEGRITTGQLVAFNALLGTTLAPLTALVGVWDTLKEVRISFERTADVLRLEREQSPKAASGHVLRGDVTLENVTFRYADGADAVLRGVTLSVRAGQKVAIVGRSGSGKTTLAGLLMSLYPPTEGRVLFDQIDAGSLHKPTLRRQIGFVEQHPQLFSGTIRENIAKADPTAGLETVVAAATMAGAHEFIQQLPLAYDTPIGERGMTLSGGQQQRLVIARALLNSPRMLVLDEATAALDTESEQIIQSNLDSMMAGRTSFVIAHRLSTVRNADKIVVLDEGRIVEEGTHAQLMAARGLYHYLATGAGSAAA